MILRCALVASVLVAFPLAAPAQLVPCGDQGDTDTVASALTAIERSVDPCGESADLVATVESVRRCGVARYQICVSSTADRNLFDRPTRFHPSDRRTITWNPELRSELEDGCGGDPAKRVMRDPVASLLHELVHAAHDCAGLDPREYELEAVRVENIYRRAAGLCLRTGYGDDRLAVEPVKGCAPGPCECSAAPVSASNAMPRPAIVRRQAADSGPETGSPR